MFIGVTIERHDPARAPFQWKPGRFKSTIVTRVWWLWFALSFFKVDEHTLATKAYDWRD